MTVNVSSELKLAIPAIGYLVTYALNSSITKQKSIQKGKC
jgi:hypothetical protein